MRTFFGNTRVMLTIALLLALVGLILGYVLKDFAWFARCGALVVSVGITLLSRASLIRADIRVHVFQSETGLSHLNPEHYKQIDMPIPEWVNKDLKIRAC